MTATLGHPTDAAIPSGACPYRGLLPFTEEDAGYFFGRAAQTKLVIANLRAYALTVLYGPSGVGKSSLLRAGVLPSLQGESHRRAAIGRRDALVYCSSWQDDAMLTLARAIHAALTSSLESESTSQPSPPPAVDATAEPTEPSGSSPTPTPSDKSPVSLPPAPRPSDGLEAGSVIDRCFAEGVSLLLVLDQFEEYFAYHRDTSETEAFAAQLRRFVQPGSPVRILISLREDALFQLDQFQSSMPGLLDHSLRLDHLDRSGAVEAIRRPLERHTEYWPDQGMTADPDLVEALLDQVSAGRVRVAAPSAAPIGASDEAALPATVERQVEAPFLQLVLTRLWHAERDAGSSRLRKATLDALGGAQTIVGEHVDLVVDTLPGGQRELAAEAFAYLVTPGGTKIAHTTSDLAALTGATRPEMSSLVDALATGERRILRSVPPPIDDPMGEPRYEVFHDVLALAIAEWRRRYVADRERRRLIEEAEAARRQQRDTRRRLRWARTAAVALAVLLVAALVAGGLAWQADRNADVRALVSESSRQLQRDPAAALAAALDAWNSDLGEPDPITEDALRRAVEATSAQLILDMGAGVEVLDAVPTPSGHEVVTLSTDGHLRVWSAEDGSIRLDRDLMTDVSGIGFDSPRDVTSLILARGGSVAVVTANTGSVAAVPLDGGEPSLLIEALDYLPSLATSESGGGDEVLAWGYNFALMIDVTTGATREFTVGLELTDGSIRSAALSPDGSRVALFEDAWPKAGTVHVCSVDTPDECVELPAGTGLIGVLAFVPGDPTRLFGADTTSLEILEWDTDAVGDPTRSWLPASYSILGIWFDASGRRLAVASDKAAIVYDVSEASPLYLAEGQHGDSPDWVWPAAFSADGNLIAEANRDGTVRIFLADRFNNRPLAELRGHTAQVTAVHPMSDQALVTAAQDGTARIWRMPGTDTVRSWHLNPSGQWVLFSPPSSKGEVVGAVSAQGCAYLVEPGSGEIIAECQASQTLPGVINDADLDEAGEQVAVVTSWGEPAVYRRDGGVMVPVTLDGVPAPLSASDYWRAARWGRGGSSGSLVLASVSGEIVAWPLTGGEPTWRVDVGDSFWGVLSLEVSADGKTVAVALANGDVVVLDAATGEERVRPQSDTRSEKVAISSDGEVLAAAGVDRRVRVWDISDAEATLRWEADAGPGTLSRLAISPDGRFVAVVGADATTVVLDGSSGKRLASMVRHADAVNDVAFAPAGSVDAAEGTPVLITSSDDGTVAAYPCELCVLDGDELYEYALTLRPIERCSDGSARHEREDRCTPVIGTGPMQDS